MSTLVGQRKGLVKKKEGPFVVGLDEALASFNVQRQAYYGGTFIGNHIHRTLKVIGTQCNTHLNRRLFVSRKRT